jgi:hypothetical protein
MKPTSDSRTTRSHSTPPLCCRRQFLVTFACACAVLLMICGRGAAQPTFSVDFQGPVQGAPAFIPAGLPICEGDILVAPFGAPAPGPLPAPSIVARPGPAAGPPPPLPNLGLLPFPPGPIGPGLPRLVEIDALSYGTDLMLTPAPMPMRVWTFSVDEYAAGLPSPVPPNVFSEGVFGTAEASANVFMTFPPGFLPPGPLPPFAVPGGNTLLFDGNGVPAPFVIPVPPIPGLLGLGLVQPNFPTPLLLPDPGSNLDALDVDAPPGTFPVYFSLDAMFVDPLELPPANSGSAAVHGVFPADIVFSPAPGVFGGVYAPAALLGLDLIGGPGSDDVDALVLWENGIPGFVPAPAPYAWLVPGGPDQLLFSLRRGSATIGALDSMFGFPICEGDILMPPVVGGLSPFPGIFIAAENLGLATFRLTPGMVAFPPFSDDLNALDVSADCNMTGIPDNFDIAWGLATDCNCNGVPDSCDLASGVLVDTDGDGIPNRCECPADVTGPGGVSDGFVGIDDLFAIILAWGACPSPCSADIAPGPCGNGAVTIDDLFAVLLGWGPCP